MQEKEALEEPVGAGPPRDWAQVYSTVHVSPVWLGGWRRGPVGVTTEAGVCEGPGGRGDGRRGRGWSGGRSSFRAGS